MDIYSLFTLMKMQSTLYLNSVLCFITESYIRNSNNNHFIAGYWWWKFRQFGNLKVNKATLKWSEDDLIVLVKIKLIRDYFDNRLKFFQVQTPKICMLHGISNVRLYLFLDMTANWTCFELLVGWKEAKNVEKKHLPLWTLMMDIFHYFIFIYFPTFYGQHDNVFITLIIFS